MEKEYRDLIEKGKREKHDAERGGYRCVLLCFNLSVLSNHRERAD